MVEDKYTFDDDEEDEKKSCFGVIDKLRVMGNFIWNSESREFCGRDGLSWAKVSFFYFIFYTCLGGFFIGMLGVFYAVTPKDIPTYYAHSSIMNSRSAKLNPGLGFRPQVDPEDHVIIYNAGIYKDDKIGSAKYINNLKNFLEAKYGNESTKDQTDCTSGKTYDEEFLKGKSCKFDYKQIFKTTNCTDENQYNYKNPSPCVLIKLNKIVSWVPEFENENQTYISIKCRGEQIVDRDNIKKITYHSEDSLNDLIEGRISAKYFPFWGLRQPSYRAPFIWAQIDVSPDTLVNIECVAYAKNIDYERLNRRGQTKFSLYIDSKKE